MDCPNCAALDSESRMQRFALFDIENLALTLGEFGIARLARIARLGKVAYLAECLDKSTTGATI